AARTGLMAGVLGALLALTAGDFPSHAAHTLTALLLSLALLTQALVTSSPGWFTAFQIGLTVTTVCAVTSFAEPRGWLDDPRGLQAHGVALGLLCLGWVGARRVAPGRLWHAFTPGFDRLTLGALVLGQVLVPLGAALQVIQAEWVPHHYVP